MVVVTGFGSVVVKKAASVDELGEAEATSSTPEPDTKQNNAYNPPKTPRNSDKAKTHGLAERQTETTIDLNDEEDSSNDIGGVTRTLSHSSETGSLTVDSPS